MEIIVGRKGNQHLVITDSRVSGKHCKLTDQPDGTFVLEDLNSTNGTFVNGSSIVKTRVSLDSTIQLGPELKIKVSDLVGSPAMHPSPKTNSEFAGSGASRPSKPTISPQQPSVKQEELEIDYTAAFNRLKSIYERYSSDKVALQKDARKKNQMKSLPMFAVGIISLFLTIVPEFAPYRIYIVIIATCLAGWGAKVAFGTDVEFPEKMEALTKQFKIDYVCPKCGNFLGDIPFENLQNRKTCGICKCKWVK